MLEFLKLVFQLILSPHLGWESVSRSNSDPDTLMQLGLYRILGVAAVTEFVPFFFGDLSLQLALIRAVIDFGTYFVSIFIARLIFEIYLPRVTDGGEVNNHKSSMLAVFAIGMMVIVQIIRNCLPMTLTLLNFLPLYVILVLYKAVPYMTIKQDSELQFLGIASVATVVIPLAIYYLLYLLIH